MKSTDIEALVDESLSGPRTVYANHVPNPREYIESIRLRFIEKRITPFARPVVIESHVSQRVGIPEGDHTVYFVTDDDPQSVFFDPKTNLFGCAWGPEQASGRYIDLGFRSIDVLEMASA